MKGVVKPQAMPTRRNPRVERNREGGEVCGGESIGIGIGIMVDPVGVSRARGRIFQSTLQSLLTLEFFNFFN